MDVLKKVVELGRNARNKANLKIRQPLPSLVFHIPNKENGKFIIDNQTVILEELNVKSIRQAESDEEIILWDVKPNLKIIGQKLGNRLPEIRKFISSKNPVHILNELKVRKEIIVNLDSDTFTLKEQDFLIESLSMKGFSSTADNGISVGISTELDEPLIQEGIVRDIIRQVQILRKDAGFSVEDRIKIFTDWLPGLAPAIERFKDYFCAETLTVSVMNYSKDGEFKSHLNIEDEKVPIALSRIKKN